MFSTARPLGTLAIAAIAGLAPSARADFPLSPFYAAVTQMKAEGKLGKIIQQKRVATPIPNAP